MKSEFGVYRNGAIGRNEGVERTVQLLADGRPRTAEEIAQAVRVMTSSAHRWLKRRPDLFGICKVERIGRSKRPSHFWTLRQLAEESWRPSR
jgi:predicted transcriptional regulator